MRTIGWKHYHLSRASGCCCLLPLSSLPWGDSTWNRPFFFGRRETWSFKEITRETRRGKKARGDRRSSGYLEGGNGKKRRGKLGSQRRRWLMVFPPNFMMKSPAKLESQPPVSPTFSPDPINCLGLNPNALGPKTVERRNSRTEDGPLPEFWQIPTEHVFTVLSPWFLLFFPQWGTATVCLLPP